MMNPFRLNHDEWERRSSSFQLMISPLIPRMGYLARIGLFLAGLVFLSWNFCQSIPAQAPPALARGDAAANYALPPDALTQLSQFYEPQPEGPYQVMIEITVFEVYIRNSSNIGFVYDILGKVGKFRGTNLAGDPTVESNLGVLGSGSRNDLLPAGANIVSNIFESDDDSRVEAVIQALAEDQMAQVYANPRLLTLNGVPARLETGEEIPYLERKNLGNTETFSTNFRQTGVTMEITPTVQFAEGDVKREKAFIVTNLRVNLSSISRYREEEGFYQPIVDTREYQTETPLRSGQRIIIASLYRDSKNNEVQGVPILKDVPIMGRLFKGTKDENRISQLFVMVRPDLFDFQGQQINADESTDPEQKSKEFRQLLEERTRRIGEKSQPFEDFRDLFFNSGNSQK